MRLDTRHVSSDIVLIATQSSLEVRGGVELVGTALGYSLLPRIEAQIRRWNL